MKFYFAEPTPSLLCYLEDFSETARFCGDVKLLPDLEDPLLGPARYGLRDWGPAGSLFPVTKRQVLLIREHDHEGKFSALVKVLKETYKENQRADTSLFGCYPEDPNAETPQTRYELAFEDPKDVAKWLPLLLEHVFVPHKVLVSGVGLHKRDIHLVFRNWYSCLSVRNVEIGIENFCHRTADKSVRRLLDWNLLRPVCPGHEVLFETYALVVDGFQRALHDLPPNPTKKQIDSIYKKFFAQRQPRLSALSPHESVLPTLLLKENYDFNFMGFESLYYEPTLLSVMGLEESSVTKKRKVL